jgi:hypothetical protein
MKFLDNSNGIQYYGGNDPAKMSGRIKKGQVAGGGGSKSNSFESKLRAGTDAKYTFDRVINKIKTSTRRSESKSFGSPSQLGTKQVGVLSPIRRQKQSMTDRDISRNANNRESQGQLNLFK